MYFIFDAESFVITIFLVKSLSLNYLHFVDDMNVIAVEYTQMTTYDLCHLHKMIVG